MRTALIVANDHYDDAGLGRLISPAADAAALSRVLGDPEVGGFGKIDVIANEASHVVQRKIDDLFSEARPDDVLLLHFSCHGLKSEAGELFFATTDTRPDRLGSTAVSADFVRRGMETTRSRYVVLFLDCCYGGAFGRGVSVRAAGDMHVLDSFPLDNLGSGRGRAVITASSAMEYSFEAGRLSEDRSQHASVFTAALVEGLSSGEADRDEDGRISLNELYEWVFDRVRDVNPNQTPSREIRMQGEFYLARSRRTPRWPAPMTAALEEARTSPDISKRLDAVRELRGIFIGERVDAALRAFHSLADTAANDIEYVAAEAASALRDARISPHPGELAFGEVARGSQASQSVTVAGPPIAHRFEVLASHQSIRAEATPFGIQVSLNTSQPGYLVGWVRLEGPTGSATIRVNADIVAREADRNPDRTGRRRARTADGSADPNVAWVYEQRRLTRERFWRTVRSFVWALSPLLSFGVLTPLPIILAAARFRRATLWIAAALYVAALVPFIVLLVRTEDDPSGTEYNVGTAGYFAIMIAAIIHAFFLRRRYFRLDKAGYLRE